MWNKFLVEELYEIVNCKLWVIPFINGSIIQSNFANYSKRNSLVVISRRSRFYAGTRYLKRGISELGDCANFVETE
jgi:phosphatidylinositol 3,5-bisphosphate 5-phosphatase